MLLFLDTVNLDAINEFSWAIYGVTTTPTFFKREQQNFNFFCQTFREAFPGLELHIEALGLHAEETENYIRSIQKEPWFDPQMVVFKLPVTWENMAIMRKFSDVKFNVHLVFTPRQAVLASLFGASYICPLLGRFDATKESEQGAITSEVMVNRIVTAMRRFPNVRIMASSIRTQRLFDNAILLGVDAITVPPAVLQKALDYDMTADGIAIFLRDMGYV